jgi:hypothetical protein
MKNRHGGFLSGRGCSRQINAGAYRSSYCLNFDGSQYFPATGRPGALSALSVVAWVKHSQSTPGAKYLCGSEDRFRLLTQDTETGWQVKLAAAGWKTCNAGLGSGDGAWHQLVGTWLKGDALRIYLDGVLKHTVVSEDEATVGAAGPFVLGCDRELGDDASNWSGRLTEAVFINARLSDDDVANGETAGGEIALLFAGGVPIDPSDVVAEGARISWYKCGDDRNDHATADTGCIVDMWGADLLTPRLTCGSEIVEDSPT